MVAVNGHDVHLRAEDAGARQPVVVGGQRAGDQGLASQETGMFTIGPV